MRKKNPKPITTQGTSEEGKKNLKPEIEAVLINSKELAKMIGKSPSWVIQNRYRIVGAQRVGGGWRFNLDIISRVIASGKNIVLNNKKIS